MAGGTAGSDVAGGRSRPPVEAATALRPWLQAQAERIEAARRIPEDVLARLHEAGLTSMTAPPRFGGGGASPREAWAAIFQVAAGCSSCAWVLGLGAANLVMIGKFSEAAQREVFLCGKPSIVPMMTGGVASDVRAERVEGGVMLSGKWRYASGIDVASWVGLLVPVPQPGGGSDMKVVLVPAEAFRVDQSSWNVLGMRGTGSKDMTLAPVMVPEHRWMSWKDLQGGARHPECGNAEPVYDLPLTPLFAQSVLAPTLGVASAVTDEFKSLVQRRVGAATLAAQIDDKVAHIDVAIAAASMEMARRGLLEDADGLVAAMRDGRPLSDLDRAAIRMRIALASRQAVTTSQRLFGVLGGSILPQGTRIERLFRDLHAMASHFLLQPEAIGEIYGRLLLGLPLPANARL